jgi:hypothetical protein
MLQAEARLALNEINVSAKLPVAALLFVCVICTFSPRSRIGVHTGDNVGVDAGEQLAAEILDAIRADRDIYVFDQYIVGPDSLERARKVLIEKRDACSDADEAAFLTSMILGLEKG